MPTHRRLLQALSVIVILTMLFSGVSSPSASAQGGDGVERQVNAQTGKLIPVSLPNGRESFGSVKSALGAIQDPNLTPTSLTIETPLPTDTPIPTGTSIPTEVIIDPTETATSTEVSASDSSTFETVAPDGITWYVAVEGNDSNSCSAPDVPCATINGALAKAPQDSTIKVGSGTYYGTGSQVVTIPKRIDLSGGWDSLFTAQTGASIIDGQDSRSGIIIEPDAVVNIDRFIITKGKSGIYASSATVTIANSLVIGNRALYGGGIYASSSNLTVQNTTISNNVARWNGGGIVFNNFNSNKTLDIINSTIVYNTADDGLGGGLYIEDQYAVGEGEMVRKSIIAHNDARVGKDCKTGEEGIDAADHNIIMDASGCVIPAGSNSAVDPLITPFLIGNPGYYALFRSSPAIGAGGTDCLITDQRGAARPQNSACDVGAYEYPESVPSVVSTLAINSGNHQRGAPNMPFPVPLSLGLLTSEGNLVEQSGFRITLTAPSTGPSLLFSDTNSTVSTVTTNQFGIATSTTLTASSESGSYIVTATANGVHAVNFQLQNFSWYVSTQGSNSNTCDRLDFPCATINGALSKPGFMAGDMIKVAEGKYTVTGGNGIVVNIDKSTRLSGGWDATFNEQIGFSIIDGRYVNRGIWNTASLSIDRFIVRNSRIGIDTIG